MLDHELSRRREELGNHVTEYLARHGIVPNGSGMIQCQSGKHTDSRPSMRLKKPRDNGVYCYTCKTSMDIFDLANKLENKPLNGPEFITDNVNHLSNLFGYPALEIKLTKKQEHELSCERLHRVAYAYFQANSHLDNAHARGWTDNDDALRRLGVGTVDNKDALVKAVAKEFGCHTSELYDYGLDTRCFGSDKLTFTLFDPKGNPIGFAGRDLNYEKKRDAGDRDARKYINPAHVSEGEGGHWRGNPLYYKNRYVYNIHNAKRAPRTIILEGYADVVECELKGVQGGIAVGGTALDKEKIHVMERTGLRDIVLGFDFDLKEGRPGQTATVTAIKAFRAFPEIRLRVLNWFSVVDRIVESDPKVTSIDVDYFLGKYGRDHFDRLLRESIHPIEFQLKEMEETGADQKKVVQDILEDVAARSTPLDAIHQVKVIAKQTGMDEDLLREEVKRQLRLRDKDTLRELHKIEKKYERYRYNAETVTDQIDAYSNMATEMKALNPDAGSISVDSELQWVTQADAMADGTAERAPYIRTGVDVIDSDLGGGLPLNGKLLVFGGKPQVGKTMLQNRIAGNILNLNPNSDVRVFVWTLDDNKETWLYRLLTVISGLPLYKCQRAYQYIRDKSDRERLDMARQKVRKWIKEGRLIIKDAQEGNNVAILEGYIEKLMAKTSAPVIILFDNFHKTQGANDRTTIEQTAERIRNLTHKYRVTILANAELRKTGADQSSRVSREPDDEDLKETGKLSYDADYTVILDSPKQRMPLKPDDPDFKGKVYTDVPNTYWTRDDDIEHLPIIWYKRMKNKIFNLTGQEFDKRYLKFDPLYVNYRTHKPTINMVVDAEKDTSRKL